MGRDGVGNVGRDGVGNVGRDGVGECGEGWCRGMWGGMV